MFGRIKRSRQVVQSPPVAENPYDRLYRRRPEEEPGVVWEIGKSGVLKTWDVLLSERRPSLPADTVATRAFPEVAPALTDEQRRANSLVRLAISEAVAAAPANGTLLQRLNAVNQHLDDHGVDTVLQAGPPQAE